MSGFPASATNPASPREGEVRQLQRRVTAVATRRSDPKRFIVRVIEILRPEFDAADQTRWMGPAHDAVLAELGRKARDRVLLALRVEAEHLVRVDAGRWRYLVGIEEGGPVPIATILEREERRW
jgi:hypothetical protein